MSKLLPHTLLAVCVTMGTVGAQEQHYTALFSGPDTSASGLATLVLSADQTSLSYSIEFVGLDLGSQTAGTGDDVIGLHFHNAPAGVNGPIVFGLLGSPSKGGPLNPALTDDVDDLMVDAVAGTISGAWETTDSPALASSFIDLLNAQSLYLNVHTNDFSGGAIRGQIIPEPSSVVLAVLALAGLAFCRCR